MRSLGPILIAVLGTAIMPPVALGGGPVANTGYVGDRSNNPEQETYAVVGDPTTDKTFAFIGPAGTHGPVTGNPEKDTIAFQPLLIDPARTQASLDPAD